MGFVLGTALVLAAIVTLRSDGTATIAHRDRCTRRDGGWPKRYTSARARLRPRGGRRWHFDCSPYARASALDDEAETE
jgi:hypothetical protein